MIEMGERYRNREMDREMEQRERENREKRAEKKEREALYSITHQR